MQESEIKLTIVLIVFLLFSPISIHAISFDEQNLIDNSENKIIIDSKIIDINLIFFLKIILKDI